MVAAAVELGEGIEMYVLLNMLSLLQSTFAVSCCVLNELFLFYFVISLDVLNSTCKICVLYISFSLCHVMLQTCF